MRHSIKGLTMGTAAILALALCVTGCAAEQAPPSGGISNEAPEDVLEVLQEAIAGPEGKDDRAFGTSDDAVLQVVEKTFKSSSARAEWSGSTLRVSMDGSAQSPGRTIPCLALEALLTDGEEAVIVYDDGEVKCADRHNSD